MSLFIAAAIVAACGDGSRDRNADVRDTEENVEENSRENISPQLEDSADRFEVDSLSSAEEIQKAKEKELEEDNDDQ